MRPTPKLVDDKPGIREAFFNEMSQIIKAKRRYE